MEVLSFKESIRSDGEHIEFEIEGEFEFIDGLYSGEAPSLNLQQIQIYFYEEAFIEGWIKDKRIDISNVIKVSNPDLHKELYEKMELLGNERLNCALEAGGVA